MHRNAPLTPEGRLRLCQLINRGKHRSTVVTRFTCSNTLSGEMPRYGDTSTTQYQVDFCTSRVVGIVRKVGVAAERHGR